tara:strand:- start:1171 stop:1356 length:186 start_codon:yes stop_codon:yes gene_type:complete
MKNLKGRKLKIYSFFKTIFCLILKLSGRPGSNRRQSAWKADALPTELLPLIIKYTKYQYVL